jgi:hypothetical protein
MVTPPLLLVRFSRGGKQVEQQGRETGLVQAVCHRLVARAQPTAAAAVREDHQARRCYRHRDGSRQQHRVQGQGDVQPHGAVRFGCRGARGCRAENGGHLGVTELAEVVVELADATRLGGTVEAHDLIGQARQIRDRPTGSHGDGHHDATGPTPSKDLHGGACGEPGGDTVVHHHHRAAGHRGCRAVPAVPLDATVDLAGLASCDLGKIGLHQADLVQQPVVEHADTALAHGPHAQLRLPRQANLAHDQDVHGYAELPGDLGTDRDATTRQGEHHRVVAFQGAQCLGQSATGVAAVTKTDRAPPGEVDPAVSAATGPSVDCRTGGRSGRW